MKRIIFALCATIVSLSATAQGTLLTRLQGDPKIDSLAIYAYNLGSIPEVTYSYDGKFHKTVNIRCMLTNDFLPTPPTGDPKKDAQNQKLDSIRQKKINEEHKVYEAVRNTCKALTDNALESYVWEYHRGGVDSVRYAIAIGEYQNGDTLTTFRNERNVYYYRAPELVSFDYNSSPYNNKSQWSPKGFGYFRYEYTPDSVYKKNFVPFDKESYTKAILPILKQEGITSRQFHVYHDSTYTIVRKAWKEDDFVLRVQTEEPKQMKSETCGTIYTMHSRAQANAVLEQMKMATLDFLEDNTGFWFSFHPNLPFIEGDRKLNEFFESEYMSRIADFYHIYIHCFGEEFNIMIVEGKGDMMVPAEWAVVKNWKNGKVTYDKRALKNLTPQQAREKTSGFSSVTTRQFEPFE